MHRPLYSLITIISELNVENLVINTILVYLKNRAHKVNGKAYFLVSRAAGCCQIHDMLYGKAFTHRCPFSNPEYNKKLDQKLTSGRFLINKLPHPVWINSQTALSDNRGSPFQTNEISDAVGWYNLSTKITL